MTNKLAIFIGLFITFQAIADASFEQWMNQQSSEFDSYQKKQDSEFASFLEADWKEFQVNSGKKRDKIPKPLALPKAPEPVIKKAPITTPKNIISVKAQLKPITKSPIKKQPKPTPPQAERGEKINILFLGSSLPIYLEKRVNITLGHSIDNKAIAKFWNQISSSPYDTLIEQIKDYRQTIEFNDWGTIRLINELANKLYRPRSNEARLFSWFLLVKSGYAARIGYTKNRIHLMLPSKTQLFSMPYFTFDNLRYYVITSKGGQDVDSIFSYEGNYPSATKKMDLYLTKVPSLKATPITKELSFNYADKQHKLQVSYDKNVAAYFENYPATQLNVYFRSTISDSLKQSLLTPLGKLVEGQSEEEAVNILLRFVQTAFAYKTDDEQFGREKYFFPEELFLYGYSDCEDRSVLFAFLVKELLGLDVVALTFPGHVATAVHFNSKVAGASVKKGNKVYVIADPTYINANAGMVMPKYKNSSAEIISISNL